MWENYPRGSCVTEKEFKRLQGIIEDQTKKITKLEGKIALIEAKLEAAAHATERLYKKIGH